MKRWPDLIALLQKKAPTLETADEQVELYLRIANLFLEKFSNQAEAIKAYEKVLELDPEQRRRARLPQADLREAPRLGEADRASTSARSSARRRRPSAAADASRWPSSPPRS